MKYLLSGVAAMALLACAQEAKVDEAQPAGETHKAMEEDAPAAKATGQSLDAILAAQPEDVQARYQYRHPKETLEFFGVKPGMTVVEALPGGGWYTKILLPYLGPDGKLIGANYNSEMWPLFGPIFPDGFVESQKTWPTDWPAQAQEWRGENGAEIAAFEYGSLPEEMEGTADAVLFIRALHNMARFEADGGYLTTAVEETRRVLKPGGIVGVVQHRAPEGNSDEWAAGGSGYLKERAVIAAFEAGGFELVDSSDINANSKDQPTEEDIVWRLPPTLGTSAENPELKAELTEIGESDRMTLKFKKS